MLLWEILAFFVIMIGASALHFAFELSGFYEPLALFASVNESTFEHLKLFFWPALAVALVEHAYVKGKANNYWWGKMLALLATPVAVIVSFYFYLGITLPLTGTGYLALDIGTGAFGVAVGNVVAYRVLTSADRGRIRRDVGLAVIVTMALLMAAAAFVPPHVFLFENFFGYEYTGAYGILEDYTPYLVFQGR